MAAGKAYKQSTNAPQPSSTRKNPAVSQQPGQRGIKVARYSVGVALAQQQS